MTSEIGTAIPLAFLATGIGFAPAVLVGRLLVHSRPARLLVLIAAALPPGLLVAHSPAGQLAATVVAATPLAAWVAFLAFHRPGPRWTALARALGDTPAIAFGRVEVPMAFPGLLAAAALLGGRAAVEVTLRAWPIALIGALAAVALILAHRSALVGTRAGGGGLPIDPPSPPCGWCPADLLVFPHLTVRENLAYAGGDPREIADLLSLTPNLDRRPRSLSLADRQCVAIGRALLARGPRRFDDPFSFLDAERAAAAQRRIDEAGTA